MKGSSLNFELWTDKKKKWLVKKKQSLIWNIDKFWKYLHWTKRKVFCQI